MRQPNDFFSFFLWLSKVVQCTILLFATMATASAKVEFSLPVKCVVGKTCWLVNLVDLDLGKGQIDYLCDRHTYDGHKGIDIAIRDLAAMKVGVPVVAAADGVIRAIRDGMPDQSPSDKFRKNARHLYCGNGAVISHGDGWETQYCHLRKNSLVVKPGSILVRGDKIGLIGHSGMAEFPHLHMSFRYKESVVDPFLGLDPRGTPNATCGKLAPIWTEAALSALTQSLTVIYNGGFSTERPEISSIRSGLYKAKTLSGDSPSLVFWAEIWWVQKGDKIEISVIGPDGTKLAYYVSEMKKKQARRMVFAGKENPGLSWLSGHYRGVITLTRVSGGRPKTFTFKKSIFVRGLGSAN